MSSASPAKRQRTRGRGSRRRGSQNSATGNINSCSPAQERQSSLTTGLPWTPHDPPKSRQDHVRTHNGKKYYWCTFHTYKGSARGCWTTHRAKDCPYRPYRPDDDTDQQRFEYDLSSSDHDDDVDSHGDDRLKSRKDDFKKRSSRSLDSAALPPLPTGKGESWAVNFEGQRLYFCPFHGRWEKQLAACGLCTREPSPTEPMVRTLYGRKIIWCPIHTAWTRCTRICRRQRRHGEPLVIKYRGLEYKWNASLDGWTVPEVDESTRSVDASGDGDGKCLAIDKPLNSKRRLSSLDMSAEGSPSDQAYDKVNVREDHRATRLETKIKTPPTKRHRTTKGDLSPHEEKISHECESKAKPETMIHEKTAVDNDHQTADRKSADDEPAELETDDDLELIQTTRTVPISENAAESVWLSEAFENDIMAPFLSRVDFSQPEHSFGFSVRFIGVEKDPSTALLEMKGLPDTVASFIPCVSSKKTKNLVVCQQDVSELSCRIGIVIDLRGSLGFRLFSIPFATSGVHTARLFLSVLDETSQPVRALRRYCKTSGACVLRLAGNKCQSVKEFRGIMEQNQGKHVLLEVLVNDESDDEGIALFKEAQQRNKKSSVKEGENVAGSTAGVVGAAVGPNKDANSGRASALVDDASPSRPMFEDLSATSTNANPIPDEDTDEEMNETPIVEMNDKTAEEEPVNALTVYSEEDLSNSIRYKTFYETLKLLQGGAAAKITSDAPFQAMRETIKELRRTLPSRDSDSKRMKRDLDMKDKLLKLYLSCEWSIRKAFSLHQTASFEIVVDQISLNFPITSYETWSNFRLCTQVFTHSNGHEERLPGLPPKSFSHTVVYDVHNDYELKTNPKSQDQALILCLSKELHDGSSSTEIGRAYLSASLFLEHCSRHGGWVSLLLTVVAPDTSAPSSFSGTIGIRARQKGEVERNLDTIHKETRRVRHVLEWISRFNSDMTAEEQESMFLSANILVGNVTLLHGAVLLEDAVLVQDLIQAGANPLTRGASNTTALDLAMSLVEDGDGEEHCKVRRREVLQVLQSAVHADAGRS